LDFGQKYSVVELIFLRPIMFSSSWECFKFKNSSDIISNMPDFTTKGSLAGSSSFYLNEEQTTIKKSWQ